MRRIAVLDAPSNLGLRPPTETSVPGCAKAPGALRDHGLLTRLNARDAGCLTPPRYDAGDWRPGDGVAHAAEIAAYSRALADRIGAILDAGEFPVILGGDCSILLGSGIAMNRLGQDIDGRIGLVFVDGHSDFRHPGNASYVGAAAGEDLALVTGRGQPDLASIEGRRPYFRDVDVVVLGIRAQDEYRLDLQAAGILTRPVPALRAEGAARSAQWARDQLTDCAGYWVHVDVDVLDPAVMPAVDAPSPGGIAFPELELLLAGLVESPHCLGVEITVFDPDYDPDGRYAAEITSAVSAGLAAAHQVALRPDLAAARRDLDRAPRPNDEAAREHRRAEAAAASVSLAAEGASGGVSGTPEEPALPATTLLAVEEGADLPAEQRMDDATALADHEADDQFDPSEARPSEDDPEPFEPEPFESEPFESEPFESEPFESVPFESEPFDSVPRPSEDDPEAFGPAAEAGGPDDYEAVDIAPDEEAPVASGAGADAPESEGPRHLNGGPVRRLGRPLGSAPLLDSEPLPATRPGMLRPRRTEAADDRPGRADHYPADPRSADLHPAAEHPAGPQPADSRSADSRSADPRSADPRSADSRSADPRSADSRSAHPHPADAYPGEGFSLPAQRPAFDVGSGEPADIA